MSLAETRGTVVAAGGAGGLRGAGLRTGSDRQVLAILLAGIGSLALPTLWDTSLGYWAFGAQGHELVFALVAAFLIYRRRDALLAAPAPTHRVLPFLALALGLGLYVIGRSQLMHRLEILSLLLVLAAVLLLIGGWSALRVAAFPMLFLLFIVPLPYQWVVAITGPMKTAVSAVAVQLLYWAGLPVARSGVIVTIGQYQLLVTEACAGLQTMFTLEAMGLLYTHLRPGGSGLVKAILAVCVVPIAFAANVIRVIALMLVTYAFGDAAGQSFVHGLAGLVLFTVALLLIFMLDQVLGRLIRPAGSPP